MCVCRSVVYQQSSKESATLQPFFTLQLDIQSEKIRTVQEALETMVARESVQGYTTKTKQEVRFHSCVRLSNLIGQKASIFEKASNRSSFPSAVYGGLIKRFFLLFIYFLNLRDLSIRFQ